MKVTSCFILIVMRWTVAISSQNFLEVVQENMCHMNKSKGFHCSRLLTQRELIVLDEAANANATLLCLARNTIALKHNPGFFVVEYRLQDRSGEVWKGAKKANKTIIGFPNLLEVGSTYEFRFHRVFEGGISKPEITEPIKFQPIGRYPKEDKVKKISLISLKIQANNSLRMESVISFVPSDSLPCFHSVTLWNTTHKLKHDEKLFSVKSESVFSDLEFDKNYTISIRSYSGQEVHMTFRTPTCLEMHKNLTVCALDKGQGVHGESIHKPGNISDINVIWDKSDLLPDYYIVELFLNSSNTMEPLIYNVSGTATKILFQNVTTVDEYHVVIVAYSSGGRGPIFIGKLNLTETETGLHNSSNIGMISVSSSGFVLGICVFAYCRRKKRNQRQSKAEDSETLNQQHYSTICTTKDIVESGSVAVKVQGLLTPVDEYEIEPDRLEIKQPLGSGAFGIVKLGSLRDDRGSVTTVAVKMLPDNPTEAERREFQREIKMMKLIRQHRNIVSILGCCTIGPEPLLIVEYCSQGDLQSFLRAILAKVSTNWVFGKDKRCVSNGISIARSDDYNSRIPSSTGNRIYDDVGPSFPRDSDTVTMIDLLNFGHQVARGMEFLSSNRVVHRDLAARNVLVCGNKAVKISDFGLSRDVYLENIYTKRGNGRLPIKWMAIEALTHQVYDTSTDVWSFGILLWEIITLGSTPYPTISPAELLKWLKLGYRMEQPENCSLPLYNLMLACWQAKPQDRPTFTTLREELNELIRMAKENDYLEFEDGSKGKLAEEEDPHF